jgi:hypothetical protein
LPEYALELQRLPERDRRRCQFLRLGNDRLRLIVGRPFGPRPRAFEAQLAEDGIEPLVAFDLDRNAITDHDAKHRHEVAGATLRSP